MQIDVLFKPKIRAGRNGIQWTGRAVSTVHLTSFNSQREEEEILVNNSPVWSGQSNAISFSDPSTLMVRSKLSGTHGGWFVKSSNPLGRASSINFSLVSNVISAVLGGWWIRRMKGGSVRAKVKQKWRNIFRRFVPINTAIAGLQPWLKWILPTIDQSDVVGA